MKILVWYENGPLPEHAKATKRAYPQGIHGALGALFSAQPDMLARTAVMQDAQRGLSDEALAWADVLVYFSHTHWREVADDRAEAVQSRVLDGMGLVLLHSAHASKPFQRLMGTRTQRLFWRENDEWQRVWVVNPAHPIAQGLPEGSFVIPVDETYGEPFEIPQPEEQVFLTTAQGGEVFRSGCCWRRGRGRIFYFSAGHETRPVYAQKEIQTILVNAARWAYGGQ